MFKLRTLCSKNLVSTKIRGKEIEFDGIGYSHTPSEIKVYAKFKGTDKEVLIAVFERDVVTDKFDMTFPKNKKYSNYTLKDRFLPDYMNTYLRQKADDELDKYFEKYMSEIEKDALVLIRRKMTSNKAASFRFRAMKKQYAVLVENMSTGYYGLFYGTLKEMRFVKEQLDRIDEMSRDPQYETDFIDDEEEIRAREEAYMEEYSWILQDLFDNYEFIDEIPYRDIKDGEYVTEDIVYDIINLSSYDLQY